MDELMGFILWLVGPLLLICFLGATITGIQSSKWKRKFNQRLKELHQKISKVHALVLGTAGNSPTQQLDDLWNYASQTAEARVEKYWTDNGLLAADETASNLGSCGVSDTHFFIHLDKSTCDSLLDAGNPRNHYARLSSIIEYEDKYKAIPNIERLLDSYVQFKKNGIKLLAKSIPLDRILYYKLEGAVQHLSNVHGGGVNLQGAAVGAVLGGGAAAIIGSQVGTETRTQFVKQDDRKITIFFNLNGRLNTINVQSADMDITLKAFRRLIPQKEESVVQVESHKKQQPAALSSADELKKFKELLDCGVISQEEFDAKKKQLLGL